MINNYEQILKILPDKPVEDLTYYCQIIKRKKDHPGLEGKNNSARLIKPYYFTCKADMERRWEEMVAISEATGARIMMDAFPKNSDRVKYKMITRLAEIIEDGNAAKLQRLYNTCYGQMKAAKDQALWLIDWDNKDTSVLDEYINWTQTHPTGKVKVVHKIPTRQGWHYLIKPCQISIMTDRMSKHFVEIPDIHKTSPTLVYIPKSL